MKGCCWIWNALLPGFFALYSAEAEVYSLEDRDAALVPADVRMFFCPSCLLLPAGGILGVPLGCWQFRFAVAGVALHMINLKWPRMSRGQRGYAYAKFGVPCGSLVA
ncbi:hypothetical protein Nepgr_029705 [Nepenthes gracilis]|uniref:Uncharacterized protein n=1 Tax=Nepenthes gracilis TaxID=150966 RepID=A0AAD3TEH6_NEPGR|nr:hypothetical protein Nepgr_029705 [Nepenthes gracilis]